MPAAWSRSSSQYRNLFETHDPVSGLITTNAAPGKEQLIIHSYFTAYFMFIFMLGLLVVTAILALKTVSNAKEMLTPIPVRVK